AADTDPPAAEQHAALEFTAGYGRSSSNMSERFAPLQEGFVMTTAASAAELTGDYDLDTTHTQLGFTARHAMVTKVRGTFAEFEGQLHIDGSNPTASSGTLRMVARSIDTGVEQRDEHLRSNDFFDMANFSEATITSTSVEHVADNAFRVTGNLTIKDVTQPVPIDMTYTGFATDPFGNNLLGLEGSVTINRKDWGLNWNASLETGGVLVSEKIQINVDISAVKR